MTELEARRKIDKLQVILRHRMENIERHILIEPLEHLKIELEGKLDMAKEVLNILNEKED